MEKNPVFDPLAWAAQNNAKSEPMSAPVENPVASTPPEGELAKAVAVVEKLLLMGANIADDEADYYRLIEAMQDLGEEGKEPCRQLCQQSAKYEERDFEYKWRWASGNQRRSIHIATFYNMAKSAGVDLADIARRFPSPGFSSKPQFPHGCEESCSRQGETGIVNSYTPVNHYVNNKNVALAKGGMSAACSGEESEEMRFSFTCTFSDKLDPTALPVTLQRTVEGQQTAEERDKTLLASLDLLAMAEPNVYGIYHGKRVYTPFYLFILGIAGIANKGVIADVMQLLMPIDKAMRALYYALMDEYEALHAEWEQKKAQRTKGAEAAGLEPKEPVYRRIFVSADSSAAAFKQDLYNYGGRGIVFSTEADTLTQVLGQEWGQFSDAFRMAFHHETIESTRAKDKQHIVIEEPQLGMLVTCTPKQITYLLSPRQCENGTSSRDLFYCTSGNVEWRSPFETQEPLADRYFEIGEYVKGMYDQLTARSDKRIQILLTKEQQQKFDAHFSPLLPEQVGLYGTDFAAFVVRIALVAFRLMMILTTLRYYEQGQLSDPQQQAFVCSDEDFHTAMTIIDCLVAHTAYVYTTLLHPDDDAPLTVQPLKAREQQLFMSLPDEFTTQQFEQTCKALGIPVKTGQRYLGNFISRYQLIERISQGHYVKLKAHQTT
jgi:hypothetical protein